MIEILGNESGWFGSLGYMLLQNRVAACKCQTIHNATSLD